mgnify:CR=1 FL=1
MHLFTLDINVLNFFSFIQLYKDTNMKIYQIKIETGYVTVWADSFMDACKEVREAGFTVLGGHQVA